jgi:hypothetical protein
MVLPQAEDRDTNIFHVLRLRQHCQFQRSVSHLNVLGGFCFLFTHCLRPVDLRKKLRNIKYYFVQILMFIKVNLYRTKVTFAVTQVKV